MVKHMIKAFWKPVVIMLTMLTLLLFIVSSCTESIVSKIHKIAAAKNPEVPLSLEDLYTWEPNKIHWLYVNTLKCKNISEKHYPQEYATCEKIWEIKEAKEVEKPLQKLKELR